MGSVRLALLAFYRIFPMAQLPSVMSAVTMGSVNGSKGWFVMKTKYAV